MADQPRESLSQQPEPVQGDSTAPDDDALEPEQPERRSEPSGQRQEPRTPLLAKRYRLGEAIGVGGQGHTYRARDEQSGAEVAIKRLELRGARDWKSVELFEREARVLQAIRHPAVPRYLDQFEHDGGLYLVMELVRGETLQERRVRGQHTSEAELWRVLAELGEVLDALHAMQPPVIHRDIKPHNIVRRADGTLALVDFGAVRDAMRLGGGSTVAGTFGYMAPEQLQGQALAQTDVYGLGATAVALLTGSEPEQMPHRGLRMDLSVLAVSEPMREVLGRMLEPDPELRPRSVREAMGRYATWDWQPRAVGADAQPNVGTRSEYETAVGPGLSQALGWGAFAVGLLLRVLGVIVLPLLAWLLGFAMGRRRRESLMRLALASQQASRRIWEYSGQALRHVPRLDMRSMQNAATWNIRSRQERRRMRDEARAAARAARKRARDLRHR